MWKARIASGMCKPPDYPIPSPRSFNHGLCVCVSVPFQEGGSVEKRGEPYQGYFRTVLLTATLYRFYIYFRAHTEMYLTNAGELGVCALSVECH